VCDLAFGIAKGRKDMTPSWSDTHAPTLLLVDDDVTFRHVLARAFARRGYKITEAGDVVSARESLASDAPEFAVIDLRMPGESGLTLVRELHALDPATRIVVLTGYASIATAVEAVKLGATHYLAKPTTVEDIVQAFSLTEGDASMDIQAQPMSVNRLEWEHIQKVLNEHQGNISATARALKMHRRTLQRKLAKRPVAE
jgi:two-component system, response regulator RegA